MGAFSTEDAVRPGPIIRTLFGHMPELLAISAFDSRIRLYVVPSHLVLELREHVLSFVARVGCLFIISLNSFVSSSYTSSFINHLINVCGLLLLILCRLVHMPSEVHVTLDGAARND